MGARYIRSPQDHHHIYIDNWYFLEHEDSVIARKNAKRNELPLPKPMYAFYGGITLTEKELWATVLLMEQAGIKSPADSVSE
jgi:hypothetical protein